MTIGSTEEWLQLCCKYTVFPMITFFVAYSFYIYLYFLQELCALQSQAKEKKSS